MAYRLETSREDLLVLLYKDELTRVFNRRYMNRQMVELSKEAIEQQKPLSLIMIDVDHFKSFNDNYGHEKGDKALVWVAETIAEASGDKGIPIRYAGDEFVIILPGVDKDAALETARNLRKKVANEKVKIEGISDEVSFTLSLGVAGFPHDTDDPSRLLTMADKASYNSKKHGRNRVSTLDEDVVEALDSFTIYRYFPCKTLVGRDELMKKLTDLVLPAPGKLRPMIVLHGIPGMGKTRMLEELFSISDGQRCNLIRTRGASYLVGQPFVEILDPITRILKNDPELASKAVYRLNPVQVEVVKPYLPIIASYTVSQSKVTDIKPADRKEALLEGLKEIILEIAADKPTFIFFDEFHYSNLGSRLLLSRVKADHAGNNVALFAGVCDVETVKNKDRDLIEFFKENQEKDLLEKIPLKPLDKKQVINMVENIIKGLSRHDALNEFIYRNSEGNPGKVEELLKKLISKKRISFEKGKLKVEEVSQQDALDPGGMLSTSSSIKVDPEVINLLSKASVVGGEFKMDQLRLLDKRSEGRLSGLLEKAEKTDLIRRDVVDEEDIFKFSEDHVKDDLYEKLDDTARMDFHRQVGMAEKKKHAENIEKVLSKLAYHFERAGDHPEAMMYLSKLAREFEGLFSPTLLEVHVGKLPDTKDDWEEEKILDKFEMGKAVRVCKRLRMVINNLDRYPAESEIVKGSIDASYMELQKLLDNVGIVSFAEADGSLLVNNHPPDIDDSSDFKESDFIEMLERVNLKGVSFRKGLTREDFIKFQDLMTRLTREQIEASGGWNDILKDKGVENILVNQKVFITMGRKELLDAYKVKKEKVLVREKVFEGAPEELPEEGPIPQEFLKHLDEIKEKYANDPTLLAFLEKLKSVLERLPSSGLEQKEAHQKKPRAKIKLSSGKKDSDNKKEKENSKAKVDERRKDSFASSRMKEMMERYNLLIMDKIKQDTDVLIHELTYPDMEVVQLAGSALLAKGREVIDPLFNFLIDSDNVLARKTGLTVLRKLESGIGKRFLQALMGQTNARQKETILYILKEFPEASLSDAYTVLLRDPDARVRRLFMNMMEEKRASHYVNMLIEALNDKNEEVVSDAATSLGNIGSDAALEPLANLVGKKLIIFNDTNLKTQEAACKAIGKIGTDKALEILKTVLKVNPLLFFQRDKPAEVRGAAAFALGYFPPEKVKDLLDDADKDFSPVVRSAVKLARSMHEEWGEDEEPK